MDDNEVVQLVDELIEIGRTDGYLVTNKEYYMADGKTNLDVSAKFDSTFKNKRAREIGETLDEKGGMDLMRAAAERVHKILGPLKARHLEAAWSRIGSWLA
ncbi:MAG TPA: hypothetical protein VMW09_07180 [Desulfatiglandales bacterium]|nr:hypothetical protein [Desulfatiglandales bacterium]